MFIAWYIRCRSMCRDMVRFLSATNHPTWWINMLDPCPYAEILLIEINMLRRIAEGLNNKNSSWTLKEFFLKTKVDPPNVVIPEVQLTSLSEWQTAGSFGNTNLWWTTLTCPCQHVDRLCLLAISKSTCSQEITMFIKFHSPKGGNKQRKHNMVVCSRTKGTPRIPKSVVFTLIINNLKHALMDKGFPLQVTIAHYRNMNPL